MTYHKEDIDILKYQKKDNVYYNDVENIKNEILNYDISNFLYNNNKNPILPLNHISISGDDNFIKLIKNKYNNVILVPLQRNELIFLFTLENNIIIDFPIIPIQLRNNDLGYKLIKLILEKEKKILLHKSEYNKMVCIKLGNYIETENYYEITLL
jgi:expansin (peptidoglycan-binding protein)